MRDDAVGAESLEWRCQGSSSSGAASGSGEVHALRGTQSTAKDADVRGSRIPFRRETRGKGRDRQLSTVVERLKPGDLKRLKTERLAHLTFSVSVYCWQSGKKRGFLHVSSWSSKPMNVVVLGLTRHADTCMFGDVTWHRKGNTWINDRANHEQDG